MQKAKTSFGQQHEKACNFTSIHSLIVKTFNSKTQSQPHGGTGRNQEISWRIGQSSSSGDHECQYKLSWQSIKWFEKYHCHQANSLARKLADVYGAIKPNWTPYFIYFIFWGGIQVIALIHHWHVLWSICLISIAVFTFAHAAAGKCPFIYLLFTY